MEKKTNKQTENIHVSLTCWLSCPVILYQKLDTTKLFSLCIGSNGFARAGPEKAVTSPIQFSARYLAFIRYLPRPFRNSLMKLLSIKLADSRIKYLSRVYTAV